MLLLPPRCVLPQLCQALQPLVAIFKEAQWVAELRVWSLELHSQFSEMRTKDLLPGSLDVLTHSMPNPHPKVREMLVPLVSHGVMTPITITSISPGHCPLLDRWHLVSSAQMPQLFVLPTTPVAHLFQRGPVTMAGGYSLSSCRHTSYPARHHPHFCYRTCGRSWKPPQYRGKRPQPGGQRSEPARDEENRCRGVEFQPWKAHGVPSSKEGTDVLWLLVEKQADQAYQEKGVHRWSVLGWTVSSLWFMCGVLTTSRYIRLWLFGDSV